MARLPYLDQSDLAPENKDLLARNINLYRAFTHSPDATRSFLGLAQYIRYHSKLDPRLREMVAQPELSDETYNEIRKGLDNERIVDLLLVISFYCGVVRLLGALQIDVEDDYRKYLREFPLGG